MQIEIKIDEYCTEPKIIIVTNKVTDEVNEIMKKLAGEQTQMIAGFQDEKVTILEPNQFTVYMLQTGRYMPKQSFKNILSGYGCMKRSSALQAIRSCEYPTPK